MSINPRLSETLINTNFYNFSVALRASVESRKIKKDFYEYVRRHAGYKARGSRVRIAVQAKRPKVAQWLASFLFIIRHTASALGVQVT